jgi:hypothetical protein
MREQIHQHIIASVQAFRDMIVGGYREYADQNLKHIHELRERSVSFSLFRAYHLSFLFFFFFTPLSSSLFSFSSPDSFSPS